MLTTGSCITGIICAPIVIITINFGVSATGRRIAFIVGTSIVIIAINKGMHTPIILQAVVVCAIIMIITGDWFVSATT
jgi:hypothetical protein